jgi:hypothetical protein
MTDQFDDYKKLLKVAQATPVKTKLREAITAAGIMLNSEEPLSGYYRLHRGKDGPLDPVAIWRQGDELVVLWGEQQVRSKDVWPYCAWMPVSFEWYEAKVGGKEWPDVHDFTPIEASEWRDEGAAPPAGDNQPPEVTESSLLQNEIAEARAGLKKYAQIISDDMAKAAQSLRSKLNELAGKADKLRKKLKDPHFEKAKAVDTEWQPIIKTAKDGADQIRDALSAWETAKLAKEQEEQVERDRIANEQAEAAEAAEWKARQEGAEPPPPPPPQPEAPPPTAPTTTIKGGTGRAASVSTVKEVGEIIDWVALFNFYRNDDDVKALLVAKANKTLKLNPLTQIPGVKIEDKRKVA